jgi:hypothetical protein
MRSRRLRVATALLACGLAAAGCSGTTREHADPAPSSPSPSSHAGHSAAPSTAAQPARSSPLRAGERIATVAMSTPYLPSAPYGTGTDDYRCFLLDPHLAEDAFITGLNILPGTKDVVHHVILFRAPPDALAAARARDAADPGEGWTCFGGTGLERRDALSDAPWLGAWAPGGKEQVLAKDVGIPMKAGSQVIMQVHYNLLAGPRPDVTSAQLRLAPATKKLAALDTMLLPAPVELPCRPGHDSNPLCDRDKALDDVQNRFGYEVGMTANYLHLLCGPVHAGPTQSCTQTVRDPATIRAVAGHMHLLGKSIKIEVDPGTPRARTVLDVPVWDFDNQGAEPIAPVKLAAGDTVRVTCRHDQHIRDLLPAFKGQPERYVVWGEGTTDEMCLGILLVTHR